MREAKEGEMVERKGKEEKKKKREKRKKQKKRTVNTGAEQQNSITYACMYKRTCVVHCEEEGEGRKGKRKKSIKILSDQKKKGLHYLDQY